VVTTGARRILLADADAFYVAVARRVDPEGAGRAKLLIVGGRPGSRGVVCSASYEARAYGVRSAMPISRALRLCPGALCVPVPRGACARVGRDIAQVLARFAPVVEPASIDEWYLDLTGTEALYRHEPLAETARRIRAAVISETGLSVSLGAGTNRLVAKLAVELAKPKPGSDATGVHVVAPGDEAEFMRRFALADIPGVGPKFRVQLEEAGLRTVNDVLALDEMALVRAVGSGPAAWLHDRVRGIDGGSVQARDLSKSLSREVTFGSDIGDDAALQRELLGLCARLAADLRSQGLTTRTINVKVRDADFRTRRASRTLEEPVIGDRVIFEAARQLLKKLRRARRVPARLLGVALTSLQESEAGAQLSLLARASPLADTERDRTLARAVDAVRERFGRAAIFQGPLAREPRRQR
jgi:DNA polymerase-4